MRSVRFSGLVLGTLLLVPPAVRGDFLEQVGDAIRDGAITLRLALTAGRVPTSKGWDLVVVGEPEANLEAKAKDGRLESLSFSVPDNTVILVGHGLRPDVVLEALSADANGKIVSTRFHGHGLGRPILWLLGGIARGAVQKIPLQTSLSQLVRGNLLATASPGPAAAPAKRPPPSDAAAVPPGPPAPSFLDLVREARFDGMTLSTFGGRHVDLGDFLSFETETDSGAGTPLELIFDRGVFRPGHGGSASQYDLDFRLEARLAAGRMQFGQDRLVFRRGDLHGCRIELRQDATAPLFYRVAARQLVLDLSRGQFRFPGGIALAVEEGSRASAADFRLSETNEVSGVFDVDLSGRTGEIRRSGSRVALESATLRGRGLRFDRNRVTGNVELAFGYRLSHQFVVHYPVAGLAPRPVPLEFSGPLTAHLSLVGVGPGEGSVTGDYSFKMPWPPVEKVALAALTARWNQDLTPALQKVQFEVEGTRFGPCGEHCFLIKIRLQAQKGSGKNYIFRQKCAPEGQADLEVDAPQRRFVLRHVKLRPLCEGVLGWFANAIAPLLTKSYEDITLLQLPEDLPFTIESVASGADWVQIGGKISWTPEARGEGEAAGGAPHRP
jgi:hypothetical protein